jgi:hypothetical protein
MTPWKRVEQIFTILTAVFIAFAIANSQVGLVSGPVFHKVMDLVMSMLALLGFTVAGPGAARALLAKAFGGAPAPSDSTSSASSAPPPTPPKAA